MIYTYTYKYTINRYSALLARFAFPVFPVKGIFGIGLAGQTFHLSIRPLPQVRLRKQRHQLVELRGSQRLPLSPFSKRTLYRSFFVFLSSSLRLMNTIHICGMLLPTWLVVKFPFFQTTEKRL